MIEKLLSTDEAAVVLGVSKAFFEKDRWRGATIPYVRIGSGKGVIRYRESALNAYLKARTEGPKLEVAG